MLFNSLHFAIFLPLVFVLYWFVFSKSPRWQNLLIVAASYVFYAWWDWRFLGLIILSTLVDYGVGLALSNSHKSKRRRLFVGLSLAVNLGLLGFFKYFNFFIDNWVSAWNAVGVHMEYGTWQIILPVGISFYTFQTLSYTIDVYRGQIKAQKEVVAFAAYVSFFRNWWQDPLNAHNVCYRSF